MAGFKRGPKRAREHETNLMTLLTKYSTYELAEYARVSQQRMWRILAGDSELGLVAAMRIARRTGVELHLIGMAHEYDRERAKDVVEWRKRGTKSIILEAAMQLIESGAVQPIGRSKSTVDRYQEHCSPKLPSSTDSDHGTDEES